MCRVQYKATHQASTLRLIHKIIAFDHGRQIGATWNIQPVFPDNLWYATFVLSIRTSSPNLRCWKEPDLTASALRKLSLQEWTMNTSLFSVLAKMYGGLLPYSLNGPFESKALYKRHTRKPQFGELKGNECSSWMAQWCTNHLGEPCLQASSTCVQGCGARACILHASICVAFVYFMYTVLQPVQLKQCLARHLCSVNAAHLPDLYETTHNKPKMW